MYPPHLSYLNTKGIMWFNPCYAYFEFWKEHKKLMNSKKLNFKDAWNHRDLKRAKEIYATAIIGLASRKYESPSQPWWIYKPDQDPPDGVIGTIQKKDDMQEMHVREIEVSECFDEDIEKSIRKKLLNKAYEPHTVFICLLSPGSNVMIVNLEILAEKLVTLQTNIEFIFVAFHGANLNDIKDTMTSDEKIRALANIGLMRLRPSYTEMSLNPSDICKNLRDGKEPAFFIFEKRGKGIGSTNIRLPKPPKLF